MKQAFFLIAAAFLMLQPARAGTLIKARETDLIEGGGGESVISAEGTNLKVETAGGSGMILLYQKNADRISLLNPADKTFRQISISELKQALNTASEMMQQVERQIGGLPPEQQAMIRDMLKKKVPGAGVAASADGAASKPPAPLSFTKKAEGEAVGPWTCTRYEGKRDGALKQEVWTAPSETVAVNADDWKALAEIGDSLSKFGRDMGPGLGATGFALPEIKDSKALGLDGFPVKVLSYGEGRASRQWELVDVKQEAFSAETFAIPSDYKKVEIKIPKISPQ